MLTETFVRRWPFCYHVTFAPNLASIREAGVLYAAQTLLRAAGPSVTLRRREADVTVRLGHRWVIVRNQRALDVSALETPANYVLHEYIAFLNERVYFWPGTDGGPIDDGQRLWASHKASVPPAIIRVPTRSLVQINGHTTLQMADCNTGAAWMERGRKSCRAPERCQPFEAFRGDPGSIAEIAIHRSARLPRCSEVALHDRGAWVSLGPESPRQVAQ